MAPSNDIRRVIIRKGPNGLGFSVKGGGDVGLPLIISRVEAGRPLNAYTVFTPLNSHRKPHMYT